MIPLSTILRVVAVLGVFSSAALHSFELCVAQQQNEERNAFPVSPGPAAGVVVRSALPSTIDWEGQQYQASQGIEILMQVSTNDHTDPKERATALVKLSAFAPSLRGTPRIPELIALYERLTQQDEKRAVIGCVAESDDKRGLPLFTKVLSGATDEIDRFQAAYALAHWNVRQGVRELVGLLGSRTVDAEGQRFADTVLKILQYLNRRNGWGVPDHNIPERISENEPDLTQEQKRSLYIAEIKKWFAENEHRFPDWKPGDPLPEVEASEKDEQGEE